MRYVQKLLAVGFCIVAVCNHASAQTDFYVGAMSDYIWRGINSNGDDPGLFAGVDHQRENGIYLGAWATNLGHLKSDLSAEVDLLLGWHKEQESGFRYGVGYIYYYYSSKSIENESLDISEFNGSLGYRIFDVVYSYDPENEDNYLEGALTFELPKDLTLAFHAGSYSYKDSEDTTDWEVSLTRTWDQLELRAAFSSLKPEGAGGETDNTAYLVATWSWHGN